MRILLSILLALTAAVLPGWTSPVHAATASGYTQTKYPIVLMHGLFGFDKLFGAYDYFYGIPQGLSSGGATVYETEVTQVGNSVTRGNQVIAQLDNLCAVYGYTKFNLIAHSQGGIDARYVAAVRPDLVASITTIATPHAGTPVADGIISLAPPGSTLGKLVDSFIDALGSLIGAASGSADVQDAVASLGQLSTAGSAQFNAQYPAGAPSSSCGSGTEVVNGIHYFSFGGTSVLTNGYDPSDPLMGIASLFFNGAASDGLVGQCSSHWGTVIRDNYSWNHLDEVNQILGLRGVFASDPVEVYRTQANRLKGIGL